LQRSDSHIRYRLSKIRTPDKINSVTGLRKFAIGDKTNINRLVNA
jgi:hypothetical protein